MDTIFILFIMIFLHIVDDFHLQGLLIQLKQKTFWEDYKKKTNCGDKYDYDWIPSLLLHCFSWTFMVMLPIAWSMNFDLNVLFYVLFGVNILVHAIVDHLKCNAFKINLVQDQSIHLFQILLTFILLIAL